MLELVTSNPLIRGLILVFLFVMIVGIAVPFFSFLHRRLLTRMELRAIAASTGHAGSGDFLTERRDSRWDRLVNGIEKAGLNLTDTNSDALRGKLRMAGFDSPAAPRVYVLLRLVLVIAVPALVILFMLRGGGSVSILKVYLFASIGALAGLYGPHMAVGILAARRREEIINSFPACLDLMLICVEAGLGLEAALDRVGREMAHAHPLVAKLFIASTLQLRAGATREAALRKMAEDAGIDEIRSFTTLLIQSDRLGTSIAATLRVYSAEMRERRSLRAEEKAHRLPVLITIPLVVCLLPVTIGVVMIPAVIRLIRQLLPVMTGG